MDIILEYDGRVSETGEIKLPKKIRSEVGKVYAGHRIEVTFRRKRRRRSGPQNAYYWAVIIPWILRALIHLGHDLQEGNREDQQDIHDYFKNKFLKNGKLVADANGQEMRLSPSTKRNTTIQQEEYHEQIRRWAAENLYIAIPLPNEQIEIWQ